jgi:hypothetical protein
MKQYTSIWANVSCLTDILRFQDSTVFTGLMSPKAFFCKHRMYGREDGRHSYEINNDPRFIELFSCSTQITFTLKINYHAYR